MSKTITAGMRTHLDGTVTSLCTIWRLIRTDGVNFYFTDHDTDIVFDDGDGSATYLAQTGYNRTAVSNRVGLNVDNLDVEGVFDDESITEEELLAGAFDYAEIRIALVNWQDLTDGQIRMRRGWVGEVVATPEGTFRCELRGLAQNLTQNIVDAYQSECRADLGDLRCMVPIEATTLTRNLAVVEGQVYKVPTATAVGVEWTNLVQNYNFDSGTTGADFGIGSGPLGWSVVSGIWRLETARDGLTPDNGTAFLTGSTDTTAASEIEQVVDLQGLGIDFTEVDAGNATMTFNCRRATSDTTLTDTGRILVTFENEQLGPISNLYDSTTETLGAEDTWFDRGAASVAVPANTRYVRIRLFHTLVSATTSDAAFDDFELSINVTTQTNNYHELYENRLYTVTTTGTTAGTQPVYDTTVGNDTTDGTAVLTAFEAWSRHANVVDVDDNQNFNIAVTDSRAVDDWFNGGGIVLEGGLNNSVVREIVDWTQTLGVVRLFIQPTFDVKPGQKLRIYPGCDKRIATCNTRFNNTINFRGEPYVPGNDQINKTPDSKR